MSTEFINDQWRLPNAWNGSESNVNKQSNYSMDFDGSSQYVDLGDDDIFSFGNGTTDSPFSISAWIKMDDTSGFRIFNKYAGNTTEYSFGTGGAEKLQFFIFDGANTFFNRARLYNTILNTGQWYHVVATYSGVGGSDAQDGMKIYVDGVRVDDTTISAGAYTAMNNKTIPVYIGKLDTSYANGQIDAVAIYNYELSSSQVTTLYGSSSTGIGNPMSLSPKPVAYYPLGDQDAFNGANYLVPNIAAQEADGDIAVSYSPYALDFDGANDYIDCGNDSSLNMADNGTDSFTFSFWIKRSSTNTEIIISKQVSSGSYNGFEVTLVSDKVRVFLGSFQSPQAYLQVISTNTITGSDWKNVIITYDGTQNANGFNMYINKVQETLVTLQNITPSGILNSANFQISGRATSTLFSGSLSNVSYWNTELTSAQVTEIYNEGVPSNLNNHSAYSNLVSWWQLGSNSSFNSTLNQWTCIDEKGTNTGESSQTFNEDAIVDGVGSYANGVGTSGLEVIGDAPYSAANSLSVNMDVEDRTTDTPS